MILRTRSLLFSWVFATQHHTSPVAPGDRPAPLWKHWIESLPAPFFVELAGQVDQAAVTLQPPWVDLPGLDGRLDGALGFAQVQAVLKPASGRPLDDLPVAPLDVRQGHYRRGVVAHARGIRQLAPGQLHDGRGHRRVLAL